METSAESWNGPERTPPDHGTLPGAASVPDQGPGIGFLRRLLGGQDEREDDCCRDEFGNALMPESYAKLSPEELKTLDAKVLRKVDLRIMPITFFLFFVNFLDRTNISSAGWLGTFFPSSVPAFTHFRLGQPWQTKNPDTQ